MITITNSTKTESDEELLRKMIRRVVRQEIAHMFLPPFVDAVVNELKGQIPRQALPFIKPMMNSMEKVLWEKWNLANEK